MNSKFILSKILNLFHKSTQEQYDLKKSKNICFLGYEYRNGDLLVASFIFREIKKVNKDIKIVVAVEKQYQDILNLNPYIDRIEILPTNFFKLLKFLIINKFDVIIDLPWNMYPKSVILAYYLSKAKSFICSLNYNFKFIDHNLILNKNEHIINFLAKIPKLFGNSNPCLDYDFYIDKQTEDKILNFINLKFDKNSNILVINAQAYSQERTLSENSLRIIVNKILEIYPKLNIIILSYKQNYLPFENSNVVVYNTSTIKESAAMIKYSNYVLTTDTAIVHISDFFNKKMVVLYADDTYSIENNIKRFGSINIGKSVIALQTDKKKGTVNDIDINSIINSLEKIINNI